MQVSRPPALLLFLILPLVSTTVLAQDLSKSNSVCGPLVSQGQYGPYDFRTDKDKLPRVLTYHFTPVVEALIRGSSNVKLGADIGFTLRAIPNHPNALVAMMRLGEREKTQRPDGSIYTVECWFERAIRFRPDDDVVRMLYATFLNKNERMSEAHKQLEHVVNNAGDNAFTHYNAGLIYLDMKEYDKALAQAHIAMQLGLNRPELSERLQAIGRWTPLPATEPASKPASQ